jgi:hypothetical protein
MIVFASCVQIKGLPDLFGVQKFSVLALLTFRVYLLWAQMFSKYRTFDIPYLPALSAIDCFEFYFQISDLLFWIFCTCWILCPSFGFTCFVRSSSFWIRWNLCPNFGFIALKIFAHVERLIFRVCLLWIPIC